jgi:uncharacterized membrane protein YphA (DoxX/SURF4 family)
MEEARRWVNNGRSDAYNSISMEAKKKQRFRRILSVLLGSIFLYTSWSKLVDPADFSTTLDTIPLPSFAKPISLYGIPAIEAMLGIFLIASLFRREVSLVSFIFSIVLLTVTIYWAINSYGQGGCGCFGQTAASWLDLKGWWLVLRDLIFSTLALLLFLLSSNPRTPLSGIIE